jgi:glycosyltransferase involved in cell wall biosynthesis
MQPVKHPPSQRPLRVLFVDSQAELCGTSFALLAMLKNFNRREIEPIYASATPDGGEMPAEVEKLGIPALHVSAGRFRQVVRTSLAVAEFVQLIRSHDVDLVFANTGHTLLFVRPAAVATRRPCVWWCHGYVPREKSGLEPIALAQRMFSGELIFANSEFTAAQLAPDFPAQTIRVIRPSVDLEKFRPDPAAGARVRREAGIPIDQPLIGIFGRLQHWKGQHVFLRAAALLAGRGLPFTAVVAGGTLFGIEPEYSGELERLAAAPSLAGRVRFLGNRRNPQDWMNACNVVVHASVEPEPWGLVVAEAMACGRAVLASSAGGPLEMIDHKRTGWLTTPGDEVALATWLEILLANPALCAELGAAARQHAEVEFDPRRAASLLSTELWRLWATRIDRMQLLTEPVQ